MSRLAGIPIAGNQRYSRFLLGAATLLAMLPGFASGQDAPRPVTLDEAIRLAIDAHPASVQAAVQSSGARADQLQARGALLPNVFLGGGYSNSSNQRFDQTTGQLVSENYTAQVQASYEIFGGGRRLAELRATGADVRAADARERAQRFETALVTTEIFFAAAAASDLLVAAEQRMARAEQQLDFARARLELGTATTSDELRAEIEVGNAELSVVDAQSSLRRSRLQLSRQIGSEDEVTPAAASLPSEAPELPETEQLVQRALRSAPSVLAAEATLRSRGADRLAALTPYLPTLRVNGGYDWTAFQFPPREQSWSLRVTASYPVFNGFQREAALSRARAQERLASVQARDATLGARVSVESAVQDIEAAARRSEISERSVVLAREDLRVQEERYQIGATTILELQASQVALAEAEVASVRARQELGSAVARLEAILGEPIGDE